MAPENISSSSSGWLMALPGEQAAFSPPRVLGRLFGRLSGGYLSINLLGVGGPVPDGGTDEAHRKARVLGHQREEVILCQAGFCGTGGFHRADRFPDIGAAD